VDGGNTAARFCGALPVAEPGWRGKGELELALSKDHAKARMKGGQGGGVAITARGFPSKTTKNRMKNTD